MMTSMNRSILLLLIVLLSGCVGNTDRARPWLGTLRHELGYLGARNWVVVAEAAFPIHSRRGLSVVQLNGEIPDVVDAVERVIEEKSHVKPRLYVATEAASVPYDYAPGIKNYREQLEEALHGRETVQLDHTMLLRMLKDVSYMLQDVYYKDVLYIVYICNVYCIYIYGYGVYLRIFHICCQKT